MRYLFQPFHRSTGVRTLQPKKRFTQLCHGIRFNPLKQRQHRRAPGRLIAGDREGTCSQEICPCPSEVTAKKCSPTENRECAD